MSPSAIDVNQEDDSSRAKGANHGDSATILPQQNGSRTINGAVEKRSFTDIISIQSGSGKYLISTSGQRIFDASSGAGVQCLGYNNPIVEHAILDQVLRLPYCHNHMFSSEPEIELKNLLHISTEGEMSAMFFPTSGSDAIEAAIKLARQYFLDKPDSEPQRKYIVSRHQSYHGSTLGALAISGYWGRREGYEDQLKRDHVRFVSACNTYRGKRESESLPGYVQRLEQELDDQFSALGGNTVLAFFAEPIVGAALGCVLAVEGYFEAVQRVCKKYGALLVFDEIMCGCGRAGPRPTQQYPRPIHAWQDPSVGVTPDIMTLGKGFGGGYTSVSAVLAKTEIARVVQSKGGLRHGHTHQNQPRDCRVALEVLREVVRRNLVANTRKMGALLGALLQDRLSDRPNVGDIRGQGLFWGIEFVKDKTTKAAFPREYHIAERISNFGRKAHNICVYWATGSVDGRKGDHIMIMPPYTVNRDDIVYIVKTVQKMIDEFWFEEPFNMATNGGPECRG